MKSKIIHWSLAFGLAAAASLNAQSFTLFPFPHKVGEYDHQKTQTSMKTHLNNGDTLRYHNARVLYTTAEDSVWVFWSRFENDKAARKMMEQMVANVRLNKGGQKHQNAQKVLGVPVHSAASEDKAHYFFQNKDQIFWITGAANECAVFLKDFLKQVGLARNERANK